VAAIVSKIPSRAKPGLLANHATGVLALGIPANQWWNKAVHGVETDCVVRAASLGQLA
jgi:hypothetical protein